MYLTYDVQWTKPSMLPALFKTTLQGRHYHNFHFPDGLEREFGIAFGYAGNWRVKIGILKIWLKNFILAVT